MSDTYRLQPPVPSAKPIPGIAASPDPAAAKKKAPGRLVSLDAYRGFIMMMLAANAFGIGKLASLNKDNAVWNTWDYDVFQRLRFHVTHPAWESITGWMGVSFWDMIQPSFMFMVGVAMPFSYARRSVMGSSRTKRGLHALVRALILVLLGVFLYSLRAEQTNWIFTNVLAQIGLGYFFAYLLLGQSPKFQMGAIAAILVGYWGFFMMNAPPADFDYAAVDASVENGEVYEGRFAPWSKNANGAHFFDAWFLNALRMPAEEPEPTDDVGDKSQSADSAAEEDVVPVVAESSPSLIRQWWFSASERHTHNKGGYVTLNFIPSVANNSTGRAVRTVVSEWRNKQTQAVHIAHRRSHLYWLGRAGSSHGLSDRQTNLDAQLVLFSGGYAMWFLAAFYLLFDILPLRRLAFPLVVVGMNSIAMYMMGQMLRSWVAEKIVQTHFGGVLKTFFGPDALNTNGIGAIIVPTAVFAVFWLTAWWMYRNRFFVRV